MSTNKPIPEERHKSEHTTFLSYAIGYLLSLYLTITAYILVRQHRDVRRVLIAWLVGLALTQFFVHMFFFLHLGRETKPRWKLFVFFFMLAVVMILVFGSLWIISNLNYRMTPQQVNTYMNDQGGF